jgi:hypothetical protein
VRFLRYFLIISLISLVLVTAAQANRHVIYGVNDGFYSGTAATAELGVTQLAVPLPWKPGTRLAGTELARIPSSQALLVVLAGKAKDSPRTPRARTAFCHYALALVRAYPNISELQVWNEPDLKHFWNGRIIHWLPLAARCYDLLHRDVKVIGPGFSPHVNHSQFARLVRTFYQRTHRRTPLFDGYSYHPYYGWQDTGIIARKMNHYWRGLPQASPKRGLRFWWTETGMESEGGPPTDEFTIDPYYGTDTMKWLTGTETQQANRVATVALRARHDPLVAADFNFLLHDERDLGRWQSGLLDPLGNRKPAFYSFRDMIKAAKDPR